MTKKQRVSTMIVCCLAVLCLHGCKKRLATKPAINADAVAITQLIEDIPEWLGPVTLEALSHSWVEGSAPATVEEMDWYLSHTLLVMPPLIIEGDTATINVHAYDTEQNETTHKWTAVKVNGEWKLKDAPTTPVPETLQGAAVIPEFYNIELDLPIWSIGLI